MGLGARKPLLLNPDLIARAKTLIRWGTLTLALSHARERGSGPPLPAGEGWGEEVNSSDVHYCSFMSYPVTPLSCFATLNISTNSHCML